MASLILEHGNVRRAGQLKGRVVIGRRTNSHIVISDRYVSRIHAWIGQADGRYFIADTGSRSGTRVNGQPIGGRYRLSDGDKISIGPATIIFQSNGPLPPDAQEMDLADRPTGSDDGIFMDCSCGAPLWAPWDFAGRVGQCRYCGQMLEMPAAKAAPGNRDACSDTMVAGISSPASTSKASIRKPRPSRTDRPSLFDAPDSGSSRSQASAKTHAEKICGACQSPISLLEETTRCPDCGVAFHTNCWAENRGCSSYGCKHVGILDMATAEPPENAEVASHAVPIEPEPSAASAIQWEYIVLMLSLIGSLVGMIAFGIPALLAGAAVLAFRLREQTASRTRWMGGALAICAVATVAGVAFSWYWWLSAPAVPRAKL